MKRRLMAVLMACVMTLSLLPISALATENSGMEFTKDARDNRDGTYTISMEAWATGKTTTSTTTVPLDIALVLDVSGSMDDPFAGDQKKIDALKTAVNGFIEGVAAKSPDSNISIVKFAGKIKNEVGNDTYRENGYRYNNTQIVTNLTLLGRERMLLRLPLTACGQAAQRRPTTACSWQVENWHRQRLGTPRSLSCLPTACLLMKETLTIELQQRSSTRRGA